MSSQSWFRVAVVMLAVPFSLIGAFWFMDLLGYNLSLAAVIGMTRLPGWMRRRAWSCSCTSTTASNALPERDSSSLRADLWDAVHDSAVMRIRPKAMTVAAAPIGLLPLMWAEGSGADTMRRIAAPMIGGLLISFAMELVVYPVIYYLIKGYGIERLSGGSCRTRWRVRRGTFPGGRGRG